MKYVDIIEYLLLVAYQVSFFFLVLRMNDIIYNDKLPTKKDKGYTGNRLCLKITYMITSEQFPQGLKDGYCVLGIEVI